MPLMRRRPLLRAAAIGGGAYMAGKRTRGTPRPWAPAGADPIGQLSQLGRLREQGVLTDDEFAQQKARILAG